MKKHKIKEHIEKLPLVHFFVKNAYGIFISPIGSFPGSDKYWKQRYKKGGNSGAGSYQNLAQFKAEKINEFIRDNKIESVIEHGCGDGNQLKLFNFPSYIGLDISVDALRKCKELFSKDNTKKFGLADENTREVADLTISLDVIYHLVEDDIFDNYMKKLFNSSKKFVIIYSSNKDKNSIFQAPHVKHRKFSKWIEINCLDWNLIKHIPNEHPYNGNNEESSFADFYIYKKNRTI
ncbi:class I SAM-dependent methyltransferase [uncultured Microbulbifer sp.]|uniref:class I SAM-dependent methyltransferase n=1 Tax=uncultured Microbulbifer sp. TaxID=348147 RepID=UPI0026118B54|nr:class I SAM-dependent methyltransferase [uncultured Microbulbifer sp.]